MTIVDTGGGQDQEVQQAQAQGPPVAPMSYAGLVAERQANGRKKLNVLDIILERRDNSVNYNLTKGELARLLFRKMKINQNDILKIDTSGFGKLDIEMKNHVNPESFVNLPAYDIRDGLRVKYYKPHHRKDTLVTINWLDLETPDELLVHVFNHFGQIKSNIRWSKIKQEEGDGDLEKLLNNILSGERQLWMEISQPLPSYAVIDKRKVKIYHPGQRRTCARCQKVADKCKGNSNAKLCEENGGEKVNVIDAWKDTLVSLNYTEWKGEGLDTIGEGFTENADQENSEQVTDITNCDGFVISNLDEEASIDDIKIILKGIAADDAISGISIHPTGSTRSKIVKDIDPTLVTKITKKIDNKSYKGRLLHCRPHVPVSPPPKKSDKPVVVVTESKAENTEPEKAKQSEDEKVEGDEASKNAIPGLSPKEIKKAKKKADRIKKKEESKKKTNEKKVKDLKTKDFMMNSTANEPADNFSDFVFAKVFETEASDSEEEVFDDSFEDLPEDVEAFITPKPFKSSYAKQVEASLTTPKVDAEKLKRSISLAELSPIDTEAEPKKVKPIRRALKSALPRFR